MQGPGDELLARARLASNEDRGIGTRNRLHFLQHSTQRTTVSDDVAEIVLGADLLLQVGILLGNLVFERLNLLEGLGVLERDGHLVGDEL